ncbi:serine/threonine-protein kinase GE16371-like isoform X2 [Daphnia pulex]|uniref:serine/threonine-protein kinase GE16371-like isoform X2 n=1 Tax=Daphnia pulex TaxID=6669 RepID=UPI001EE0D812|nr:serine/threonine-protein kinase GE16371-like isoform X2 [Daphnia pulex]
MSKESNFDRMKILGEGSHSVVFEGVWGETRVAVKRIELFHKSNNDREEEVLRRLNHPNIVKLFDSQNDAAFRYYFLELCNASLDQLFLKSGDLRKYHGSMPPAEDVLYQLAIGLEYIHKMGLIHRNLNPRNVLIWMDSTTKEVLMKWADFGISKLINERGTHSISGSRGSDNWYAPEIMIIQIEEEENGEEEITRQRGTVKSDVFTEGLIFGYYLLDGFHPYGSRYEIQKNILEDKPVNLKKIPPMYDKLRGLIQKMLIKKPEDRITSSDVAQQLEQVKRKNKQAQLVALPAVDINPNLKEIKVDVDKILGVGGYGKVFHGIWNNTPVAVKRIPLSKIESNQREEEALQMLNHPNVIKLFHTESDDLFKYFALECCQASLDKIFLKDRDPQKYRGPVPPTEDVLCQLAEGLEYIHSEKLIHRDLKPQNVLIWLNSQTDQVLMKWTDFGLSKPVNRRGTFSMTEVRGTFDWLAPEILRLLDDGDDEVIKSKSDVRQSGTVKSDVFAEGLVFGYFLLNGQHLYGSRLHTESNIFYNRPVNLQQVTPDYAQKLIVKMLEPLPGHRISSLGVAEQLRAIKKKLKKV